MTVGNFLVVNMFYLPMINLGQLDIYIYKYYILTLYDFRVLQIMSMYLQCQYDITHTEITLAFEDDGPSAHHH